MASISSRRIDALSSVLVVFFGSKEDNGDHDQNAARSHVQTLHFSGSPFLFGLWLGDALFLIGKLYLVLLLGFFCQLLFPETKFLFSLL